MALITEGSIKNFTIEANTESHLKNDASRKLRSFFELEELSADNKNLNYELSVSEEKRGLALKSFKLNKSFEDFISTIFNPSNEIYFIAWSYDLSGEPVHYYPGEGINPQDVVINVKKGKLTDFIGDGINLFPKRQVKGGIAVRLFIWESDQKSRDLGETLVNISNAISESELNNVLSLVSLVTGVTINLIEKAALELTKVIGTILKMDKNDYVDLFEGYYAADTEWKKGLDSYSRESSEITLNKY